MYLDAPGAHTVAYSAFSVLEDMHDPTKHNGVYVNMPSGLTESHCNKPNTLREAIMAGFDAAFHFNQVGFHQEGYQDAIVLNSMALSSHQEQMDLFKRQRLFIIPPLLLVLLIFDPLSKTYLGSPISLLHEHRICFMSQKLDSLVKHSTTLVLFLRQAFYAKPTTNSAGPIFSFETLRH